MKIIIFVLCALLAQIAFAKEHMSKAKLFHCTGSGSHVLWSTGSGDNRQEEQAAVIDVALDTTAKTFSIRSTNDFFSLMCGMGTQCKTSDAAIAKTFNDSYTLVSRNEATDLSERSVTLSLSRVKPKLTYEAAYAISSGGSSGAAELTCEVSDYVAAPALY